jgi:lauroyl/myristoyl acyltransferase
VTLAVRHRAGRPFANAADLRFILELPWLWFVSWLIAERRWRAICRRMEALKAYLGLFDPAPAAAAMARAVDSADPLALALESAAGRSECHLQILRSLRPGGWRPAIRLSGEEHLAAAAVGGRGCLLWVAHFCFNSLAVKIALARAGYRLWHVSRPEHGFSKSRLGIAVFNRLRIAAEAPHLAGRIVIDRSNPAGAMLAARRVLEGGGIVSITAGAWEGIRLGLSHFLGGRLPLAPGAPGLAILTGAPLLPVFAWRGGGAVLNVEIDAPLVPPAVPRAAATRYLAQAFADRTAAHVLRVPAEWRDWKNLRFDDAPSDVLLPKAQIPGDESRRGPSR